MVNRRAQIGDLPIKLGLGDRSGQFADDVGAFGKRCDIALPGRDLAGRAPRLPRWSSTKVQIGIAIDDLQPIFLHCHRRAQPKLLET
jgi:hypothetical protein